MQSRVIVPTDMRVETRSGTRVLVVKDGNGQEYTSAHPYLVNKFDKHSDKYRERIGDKWRIAFSKTEQGFMDFEGFLYPDSRGGDDDQVEDRVAELEEKLSELRERVGGDDDGK